MVGMTGLLNAQMNLEMASKVQQAGSAAISAGRILEREGIMSKDAETAEKGLALQAEGEETKAGSLKHLSKAMDDVKAAAKDAKEEAKAKAKVDREEAAKADKRRNPATMKTHLMKSACRMCLPPEAPKPRRLFSS